MRAGRHARDRHGQQAAPHDERVHQPASEAAPGDEPLLDAFGAAVPGMVPAEVRTLLSGPSAGVMGAGIAMMQVALPAAVRDRLALAAWLS